MSKKVDDIDFENLSNALKADYIGDRPPEGFIPDKIITFGLGKNKEIVAYEYDIKSEKTTTHQLGRKRMRIKIVKSSSRWSWYRNKIGQEYDVVSVESVLFSGKVYIVKKTWLFDNFVEKEDCEIISN